MLDRILLVTGLLLTMTFAATAGDPQNLSNSPEIKIEGIGKLSSKVGAANDGFVAQFTPIKPSSISCSGSCGDRWSGSWTCNDDESCYLDCSSDSPAQCSSN